jgi:hypothetical protein
MQDATVGSQDAPIAGYSLQEAAALLGIGVNTLRRRIAANQVRAEQVERPQGYVWRVYLDGRHPPTYPTSDPPDQEATGSLPHPPAPVAQAEALAALIQATLAPIVAPLVAEQAALRQTVERQAEQVADLRETIGRQHAELEAERRARQEFLTERDAAEADRRRLERRLRIGLALAAVLAIAALLAPAWVR